MTIFDDREKAFEAKYQRDEERAFKIRARRDKLLGLWAAGKLGLDNAAAMAYAADIVELGFADPNHARVIEKVAVDLGGDRAAVEDMMVRLLAEARAQVETEAAAPDSAKAPQATKQRARVSAPGASLF